MVRKLLSHPASFFTALILISLIGVYHAFIGFGISSRDAMRARQFLDVLGASQTNPDFRKIVDGYCIEGSELLRARFWWVRAPNVVMIYRRHFAKSGEDIVDEFGSQVHYDEFEKGALSSYLMLCSEQGLEDWAPVFEALGQNGLTDDSAKRFLESFKMEEPVVTDRGAIASVHRLHRDIDLGKSISIRSAEEFTRRIRAQIAPLAESLQLPASIDGMSPAQQLSAYRELDAFVQRNDPELWRVKQVSDFLAGVWGQTYGIQYQRNLQPFLAKRERSRLIAAVCFAVVALLVGIKWATKKHVLGEEKVLAQN